MMTITSGTTVKTLKFYYDAQGVPFYLDYNGTEYFYITNLHGDVVGLSTEGGIIAYYEYDAWGRILTINSASSMEYSALTTNPLRYRRYIYDNETGFYYLQTRYYDPAIRRFINADGYVSTGTGLLGYNMFAYCNNNPIIYVDKTGEGIGALLGGFIGAIGGAVSAALSGDSILAGMVTGAVSGALCGAICDMVAATIATGGLSLAATALYVAGGAIACGAVSAVGNFLNQTINYGIDRWQADQKGEDMESYTEYLDGESIIISALVSSVMSIPAVGGSMVISSAFGRGASGIDKVAENLANTIIGAPINLLTTVIDWIFQEDNE